MSTTIQPTRLLVIADVWCTVDGLCDQVRRMSEDPGSEVFVVAPALTSRVRVWSGAIDHDVEVARDRLEDVLGRLHHYGVAADGRVADEDPALAVEDALREFPATHLLLVAGDRLHAHWREHDLVAKIGRPGLPVTHLTVAGDLLR